MPQSHKKKPVTKKQSGFIQFLRKIGNYLKSHWLLLVIVLLVFDIVLYVAITQVRSYQAQTNTVIALYQKKTYNGVSVAVTDVKEETGYVMGIVPSSTEKIISLQLRIENNSEKDFEFYPTVQTFIRDNQGDSYIVTPVEIDNPLPAKTLKPGESVTGRLSYKVTNRPLPLYLYIESRQPGAGPFVVQLQ